MDRDESIIAAIRKQGFLPLYYNDDRTVCVEVAKALYAAGVRIIEFTNRGDQALENFKAVSEARDLMPGLVLAAGTIRTAEQAVKFMDAGADFLISPVFDADVCDAAYLQKVPWIPGCMTPTEIHEAEKAGCRLVKLFPGNILGPAFVLAVKELFPAMSFMPTGGVELEEGNIAEWFSAGVIAVGLGSKVISKAVLEKKDYATITKLANEAVKIIAAIKHN